MCESKLLVPLVVFIALAAAPVGASAQGACDSAELAKLLEAVPEIPDRNDEVTAYALPIACKLPLGLDEALRGLAQAPPDMRSLILSKGLSQELGLLGKKCSDPIQLMLDISALAPAEKTARVAAACKLGPLATTDELGKTDALSLLLSIATWAWLEGEGVPEARHLSRLLAGFERGPAKEDDLPQFIELR